MHVLETAFLTNLTRRLHGCSRPDVARRRREYGEGRSSPRPLLRPGVKPGSGRGR